MGISQIASKTFLLSDESSSFKVSDRHLIFNPNKRSRKSYDLILPYEIVEYHLDTLDTVYQKKNAGNLAVACLPCALHRLKIKTAEAEILLLLSFPPLLLSELKYADPFTFLVNVLKVM